MSPVRITHAPPKAGWLTLQLWVEGQCTVIDASDVPNNPIDELTEAILTAAEGSPAIVWFNLEPDGYFMHFKPMGGEIEFRLDFAHNSDPSRAKTILSIVDRRKKLLMFFWRFLRDFQSHNYSAPDWPESNFRRMKEIKGKIAAIVEA